MQAILYSWKRCSFCNRAEELLAAHGIAVDKQVLDGRRSELERLQRAFGARTLPLVLVDGEPLAGLPALETWLAENVDRE